MAEEQSSRSLITRAIIRFFDIENPQYLYLIIGLLILGGLGYGLFQPNGSFLDALKDTDTARALITFLVAVTTVSIALLTALYAVSSNQSREEIQERFALAKEVLALLVGILGTVLGFYYGAADKDAGAQLQLAELQLRGTEVITHVSGGVAPYRFSISYPGSEQNASISSISQDGWIIQSLSPAPDPGVSITVEVIDAKEQRVSKASSLAAPVVAPATSPGQPPQEQPSQ